MTTAPLPTIPLDPELAAAAAIVTEQFDSMFALEIGELRARTDAALEQRLAAMDLSAVSVVEQTVPGPPGGPDLTLVVVGPRQRSATAAPCLYSIHGGGMIIGSARSAIPELAHHAAVHGTVGVSVEYRLAPEHPDPAPVEDGYAGLVWTAAHAAELGIDPARIVATGSSSGGGIAAGVALLARDRGGPVPAGAMLLGPMLDDRDETVSTLQHEQSPVWGRARNRWAWDALLGARRGGPDVSAYAAPARATDVSGLPPIYLDTGSAEVFRDETVALAARIWAAGGSAELHVWAGAYHSFDGIVPTAAVSIAAKAARESWLRRTLGL